MDRDIESAMSHMDRAEESLRAAANALTTLREHFSAGERARLQTASGRVRMLGEAVETLSCSLRGAS